MPPCPVRRPWKTSQASPRAGFDPVSSSMTRTLGRVKPHPHPKSRSSLGFQSCRPDLFPRNAAPDPCAMSQEAQGAPVDGPLCVVNRQNRAVPGDRTGQASPSKKVVVSTSGRVVLREGEPCAAARRSGSIQYQRATADLIAMIAELPARPRRGTSGQCEAAGQSQTQPDPFHLKTHGVVNATGVPLHASPRDSTLRRSRDAPMRRLVASGHRRVGQSTRIGSVRHASRMPSKGTVPRHRSHATHVRAFASK